MAQRDLVEDIFRTAKSLLATEDCELEGSGCVGRFIRTLKDHLRLKIVKRDARTSAKGFEVLPRRWGL